MAELFIVGGRQRLPKLRQQPEWHMFDEACLVRLDTRTGEAEVCMRYTTPEGLCPQNLPCMVFKSGSWDGPNLLLCTQTEVLTIDPECMEIVDHYSHRWLNDVHHVARIDGRIHIVSTGLDALLIVRGDEPQVRPALEEDLWARLDPERDYRLVSTTKPHHSHPNFVFRTDEGIWLTRFEQRDAICLDDRERRVDIPYGIPHDGHVIDGRIWFTTVTGHVVEVDARSADVLADHDLNEIAGDGTPLGWSRGLLLQGNTAFVGVTRIRRTKWRQNLSWIKRGFREPEGASPMPTSVVAFDLAARAKVGEWDLEDHISAVFSVLSATPPSAATGVESA